MSIDLKSVEVIIGERLTTEIDRDDNRIFKRPRVGRRESGRQKVDRERLEQESVNGDCGNGSLGKKGEKQIESNWEPAHIYTVEKSLARCAASKPIHALLQAYRCILLSGSILGHLCSH